MTRVNSRYYEQEYYTQGNTARKLDTVPARVERPYEEEREERQVKRQEKRQPNQRINRNARRAQAFSPKYTAMLMVATVFLFASCFYMLTVQAEITEQRREIAILESSLNALTDNNNETSKRIESSVNLPEIYKVATTELGMVYPKAGQVVSYEASNPDYVKQFKDVPQN